MVLIEKMLSGRSYANTDIAKVEDGKVVVYGKGKTVISAEVNGKVYKCNLDVRFICPYFYIDYSYRVMHQLLKLVNSLEVDINYLEQ